MKYVVISQPKAGTYLAANILKSLGITFSNVHIDPGMYRIFYNNDLNNASVHRTGLKGSLSAIPKNQFGVGHIPFNKGNKKILLGVKKVLITRNREDIHKSAERYLNEKGVSVESIINSNNLDVIESWKNEPDVFHITFEQIVGKDTAAVNNLQMFLFGSVIKDSNYVIDSALNMDSLTKSSIR